MLNEHTKFWINTWEVSVCKEWISLQGLLLMWQVLAEPLNPSGLSGDRGDSSNWPRGQDSTSDKAIPPAEQGRCVAPAVYVSALLPWGATGQCQAGMRSPYPVLQPLLWNCTCCMHLDRKPGGHSWFSLAGQSASRYSRMNLLQAVKCFSWSVW